jgi:hypothetical protein
MVKTADNSGPQKTGDNEQHYCLCCGENKQPLVKNGENFLCPVSGKQYSYSLAEGLKLVDATATSSNSSSSNQATPNLRPKDNSGQQANLRPKFTGQEQTTRQIDPTTEDFA